MTLAIQEYLRSGHAPNDLKNEFDINSYSHPELPLVGFKYGLSSPKFDPIVRDARGIVLEEGSWDVVARPFRRFFNLGESPEDDVKFDWTDFEATSKEDGSLIIVANYHGHWLVNTSGSFGYGNVGWSGKSWRDLFWEVSGIKEFELDPLYTYLFELWTPYNKIVRSYESPRVYLLSGFNTTAGWECSPSWRKIEAELSLGVPLPDVYYPGSQNEVRELLESLSSLDSTYEGLVLRDSEDNRIKIKTQSYLTLHYFYDNGAVYSPKRLVPLYLSGDQDEVLLHFPEVKPHLDEVGKLIEDAFADLSDLWNSAKDIESQKDFAEFILPRTPFSAILFQQRKINNPAGLKDQWRRNGDLIYRKLFEEKRR